MYDFLWILNQIRLSGGVGITAKFVSQELNISSYKARSLMKSLKDCGCIRKTSGHKYVFCLLGENLDYADCASAEGISLEKGDYVDA